MKFSDRDDFNHEAHEAREDRTADGWGFVRLVIFVVKK
jgi:hypothetical protein